MTDQPGKWTVEWCNCGSGGAGSDWEEEYDSAEEMIAAIRANDGSYADASVGDITSPSGRTWRDSGGGPFADFIAAEAPTDG